MWLTDLFLSLPQLPLLLLIIYLFRDSLKALVGPEVGVFILIVVVIGGFRWMPVARLVRAQFLSLREKEFVEAARALGASKLRLVVRHILPNSLGPVIVAGTIDVAAAIIAESTLSFLGLGFPPDIPDLGPHPVRRERPPRRGAALGALSRHAHLPHRAFDQLSRRRAARRARSAQGDVSAMAQRLLEIRGLKTHFATDDGMVHAVDGVDLTIDEGETLGVVGESGSGKSVTAFSVMRLLPMPPARIVAGEILFRGRDLLKASDAEMRAIRAQEIAMVFQEPMTSLNPVYSVGEQIAEVVRLHEGLGRRAAMDRAVEMLRLVRIPHPERRVRDYPHQFSGGMRQRVMIAMALSCNPKLLIADEPTTALDVTIQAQILDLLGDLKARMGMAVMLITHAMGVIAETAQRVVVMYAGKVVEEATVERALPRAAPSLYAGPHPLDPAHRPRGHARRSRSRRSAASCRACSIRRRVAASRRAARFARAECTAATPPLREIVPGPQGGVRAAMSDPLLRVRGLIKHFPVKGGILAREVRARARGRRRELRPRVGRDAGTGGRIGLRQVDDRPLHPEADRAHLRRGLVRRQGRHRARSPARCSGCAATCRSSSRTRSRRSIRA